MEDELNLVDYWSIVKKKRRMIIGLTLAIVLITTVFSLIAPRTYESEAVIELGRIAKIGSEKTTIQSGTVTKIKSAVGSELVLEIEEAKSKIKSSVVLKPVIEEFFTKKDKMTLEKFNEEAMEVKIITEQISLRETRVTPYLNIKIASNKPTKSRNMVLAIINQFFDYANKEFDEKRNLFTEEYNKTKQGIKKEIRKRNANIVQFKEEIEGVRQQINSLSSEDLSSEGISKSTLLTQLLDGYIDKLLREENKKMQLEQQLNIIELELGQKLVNTGEFKIISQPQIPLKHSKPKILFNIMIAFVIGIFVSISLVFFQEAVKKR